LSAVRKHFVPAWAFFALLPFGLCAEPGMVRGMNAESAAGVAGDVGANNEAVRSLPGPARADGWIELRIRSILLMRPNVSAAHTEVVVRDGVVTLNGTAASIAQRELTGAYARDVEGVRAVNNRLKVQAAMESRG
jgi:osmotically-inducible protein OsmY